MENLNLVLSDALDKYFSTLAVSGHVPYKDVQSLIVLIGIYDLLTYFSEYITDEDLHQIIKALDCIDDNCFINTPTRYNEDASLFELFKNIAAFRATEEANLRVSEVGIFRGC